MFTSIVWVVEFISIETGMLDTEELYSEDEARKYLAGPWGRGYKPTAMWCEIHTVTRGPKEVF